MQRLLCLACGLIFTGVGTDLGYSSPQTLIATFSPGFMKKGYHFEVVSTRVVRPAWAGHQLNLVWVNGERVAIKSMADLAGKLNVESGEDALTLCRVANGIDTAHMVTKTWRREVLPVSLQKLVTFWDKSDWPKDSGYEGILSSADFKRLQLRVPTVERSGKAWVVERTCVALDSKVSGFVVERLRETVGPTGEYAMVVTKSTIAPSWIDWTPRMHL